MDAAKPKRKLSEAFEKAVSRGRARLRDVREIFIETARDIMSSRKEALMAFVSIVILPGGQPAYLAYRIAKHIKLKAAANDNQPRPVPERRSVPPGPSGP